MSYKKISYKDKRSTSPQAGGQRRPDQKSQQKIRLLISWHTKFDERTRIIKYPLIYEHMKIVYKFEFIHYIRTEQSLNKER